MSWDLHNMTELREKILADPSLILDDRDVMAALVGANEKAMGDNVVDLRATAMERMEAKLDKLEKTHGIVVGAAYENLAGTNQVHRAALRLLDPVEFDEFLGVLSSDFIEILRVESVRLVLEGEQEAEEPALARLGPLLQVAPEGTCASYMGQTGGTQTAKVVLRQSDDTRNLFTGEPTAIASEACLLLDLGKGRLPAMLVLGSTDPAIFAPQQGTALMEFLAGVCERSLRRWLA